MNSGQVKLSAITLKLLGIMLNNTNKGAANIIHAREIKNAEDPGAKRKEKIDEYNRLQTEDPAKAQAMLAEFMSDEAVVASLGKPVEFGDEQIAFVKGTLAKHAEVRWTFLFLHEPAWENASESFKGIQKLLKDRDHTFFAGHLHYYDYDNIDGHEHITMGPAGASFHQEGPGNVDHITWVTMTEDGPVISNLLLNGILDKRGAVPALQDFLLHRPRQITQTGQSLGIKSVPNLRDLGGYQTSEGATVAGGLVYRSNQLHHISQGDMKQIADLNLKYVYDLRTYDEMKSRPEELPPTVSHVWLDVLADSPQAGPAMLEKLMKDPKVANAELGDGKAAEGFKNSYREFVSLPSAQREYRKLFLSLANENMLPALFHCTTGKDRTGWAAAAFLTLLGVPKDVVMEDYLRSNDYIIPKYRKVIEGAVASGIDEEIPLAILGVKEEYLEAGFEEMEKQYGTIEKYFSEGLGIDATEQKALRDLYLGRS